MYRRRSLLGYEVYHGAGEEETKEAQEVHPDGNIALGLSPTPISLGTSVGHADSGGGGPSLLGFLDSNIPLGAIGTTCEVEQRTAVGSWEIMDLKLKLQQKGMLLREAKMQHHGSLIFKFLSFKEQ